MSSGEHEQQGDGPTQAQPPPDAQQPPNWQPPGGQPPGSQPPPYQPFGPYGPYPVYALPRHPDAMTALALGAASLLLFPPLGPFGWYIGARVSREIAAAPGRWSGDDLARIGMVTGMIGTALCAIFVLMLVLFFVIGFSVAGGLLGGGFGAMGLASGAG